MGRKEKSSKINKHAGFNKRVGLHVRIKVKSERVPNNSAG